MLGLGNLLTKSGVIKKFPNDFSFNFDGSDDYLEIADTDGLDVGTNDFTFSAWVYLSDASENYILSKGDADNHYGFRINGNRRISYEFEVSTTNKSATDDGTQLTLGQWHHVAVVFDRDGSTYRYLDGVNTGTNDVLSGNTGSLSTTDNLNVGRKYSGHHYFDGLIDEVGIWAYALAATDIAKIASKPSDLSKASSYVADRSSTLKLWLRAGDKVLPEEDASIARSDFYTAFDGSSEYVSVADDSSLTQASGFTVTCWVKFDSISGDTCIVAKHADYADVDNTGEFFIINDDGICEFVVLDHTNSASIGTYTGTVFAVDTWYHVTCAYDGGTASSGCLVYINGLLQAHNANATGSGFSSINDTSQPLTIGAFADAGEPHNGQISNLTMAQTTLDAQTIKQLSKSRFLPQRQAMFSVVDFDGTNPYIVTSGNVGISGSSARTLGLWFKPTATDQTYYLIEWGGTGSANATCGLYLYSSKIYFYGWGAGDFDTGVAPLSTWQHLYATYDGTTVKVYLNGALIGSSSESLNTADTVLKIVQVMNLVVQ